MSSSASTVVQGGRGARGSTTPTNPGRPMARAEIETAQAVWLAGHASSRMAARTRRAVRRGNPDRCRRPDRRSPSSALRMGAVTAPSRTRPLPQHRHLSLADLMGDARRLGKARRASRPLQPTRSARSLTCSRPECRCPRRTSRASSSPARRASKARWSWTVYRLGRLRAGRSCGMDGLAVHPPGPTWHCPPAVGMAGSSHQSLRSGRTQEWCGSTGLSARVAGLVARACRRRTASAQSLVGRRRVRRRRPRGVREPVPCERRLSTVATVRWFQSRRRARCSMPWTLPRVDRRALRLGRPRRARGTP